MTPPPAPRLLYFTAAYRPGSMAIPVHTELLHALAARGYPSAIVTLATPGQRQPVAPAPDGDLPVYRVAISRHPLDRLANRVARGRLGYPYLFTAARYLRPWLRGRLAADPHLILQAEMAYPMAALVRRALPRAGLRAVVTLHGGDVLTAPEDPTYGNPRTPAVRRELERVFAWAAAVRAMSPLLARRAVELGCPPEKVVTIPLNLTEHFYPTAPLGPLRAAARAAVGAELGLPPDARLLIAGGRALPIKGFDLLLAALPAILARHPATHLILYGPERGDTIGDLRSQARALGLTDRVHFIGELPFEGQQRYQAAADLVVIPSLLDGFNRLAVEAGAHGTPIVVSTRAGVADYVREFGAGRTVPPRDPAALAGAIGDLLADPDAWPAAGAAATRLAEECRTARVADALAALYDRLGGPG